MKGEKIVLDASVVVKLFTKEYKVIRLLKFWTLI